MPTQPSVRLGRPADRSEYSAFEDSDTGRLYLATYITGEGLKLLPLS
jgi:hypothetical protein